MADYSDLWRPEHAGGTRNGFPPREAGLSGKIIFVGHELTDHSHKLLEQGEMDIVFAHDMDREVSACVDAIEILCRGERVEKAYFPSLVYTKYSRF